MKLRQLTAFLFLFGCAPCDSTGEVEPVEPSSAGAVLSLLPAENAPAASEVERGRALITRYECNRCHQIANVEPPPLERNCMGCHRAAIDGEPIEFAEFGIEIENASEAGARIDHLLATPNLVQMAPRFRFEWLRDFLAEPADLRPHLSASMPRLGLTESDAAAIASALLFDSVQGDRGDRFELRRDAAGIASGEALFEQYRCGRCHAFAEPASEPENRLARLAPDLRWTRERYRHGTLIRWIQRPESIVPNTQMPNHGLTEEQSRQLAQYILFAELSPPVAAEPPPLLELLERPVSYSEVSEAVFSDTCRHCHSDPAFAFGEGGPGNTGGFGFEPRRLDLSSYEGVQSGLLIDGRRASAFRDVDGMPLLIRALRARQLEEAGQFDPNVRGMPLGHPAVNAERLQLVRTWVAQGRPRE